MTEYVGQERQRPDELCSECLVHPGVEKRIVDRCAHADQVAEQEEEAEVGLQEAVGLEVAQDVAGIE